MDVHLGVIRDKQGIYSALLQSQSLRRQLAVCYSNQGQLIVKICTVKEIERTGEGSTVTFVSLDEASSEARVPLDQIQSIYPIRDFIS